MTSTRKLSVSLSADLVDDLDVLSTRMGVSRSAIISGVLAEPLHAARVLLDTIPGDHAPGDTVRMRGDSIEIVQARLASLLRASHDLLQD